MLTPGEVAHCTLRAFRAKRDCQPPEALQTSFHEHGLLVLALDAAKLGGVISLGSKRRTWYVVRVPISRKSLSSGRSKNAERCHPRCAALRM